MNESAPALGDSEIRSLLELAPDGIFVADVHGRYTYVNAAGARLLGREKGEILGGTIMDLIHPDEVPRLLRERDAMLEGRPHVSEWKLQRGDGSWVDVEITANILPGGPWQGFVRDISQRKAHEAEREALLQRAERKRAWLDAVVERLPVGVVLFQVGGAISFNRHAEYLLGTSLSEQAGPEQYANRIFYADGRPVPLDEFPSIGALQRRESSAATEYIIRRDDGTQITVLGSVGPILGADGRVLGAVGVFQDVSESMRLQRAVRENERLLEAVFELLPAGVAILDVDTNFVRVNRARRQIWRGGASHTAEEGEQRGWWVATGRPIAQEDWPGVRAVTHGETTSNALVRLQCFDGSTRTVIKYAAPLRDDQGRITGAVVVDEDVTELYETQQKLKESERLFRTVIDLLPVGVYIADADGRIVLGNPAGVRIWQGLRHVGPEEFHEYKAWWIDTGQPISTDEWGVTRAVRRGLSSRSELIRIQCFDGSFKTVMNWAAPIRSETGEITGAVALNEDVTALYHTQEQLRTAVRDREHILAVVAHDLRTPLIGLALQAASCERKAQALPGGEALRESAAAVREIARGMSGLVDDLLAISVGAAGHSMLKFTPIAPEAVMGRAVGLAKPLFEAAGLTLSIEAAGEFPVVQVDVNRIQRVFANLLDNALKFTDRGGHVILRAEPEPGAVLFSVSNTGPALSPEEMERLFQPFWQAGREDRRGAGLGLSICRSIVEAHGGSIWTEAAAGMRVKILFLLPSAIPKG